MIRNSAPSLSAHGRLRRGEQGYVLVALLALMTVMALAMTVAAPRVQQQAQRELEKEAIARGEEVAEAIAAYHRGRGVPPTSMEQLLEGIPFGTKKVQILRPAAAKDPLSESGEWLLVRPRGPEMSAFQQAVMLYGGGVLPQSREPWMRTYYVQIVGLTDTGVRNDAPGDEEQSDVGRGPFIGVASRSRRASVLTYYGIERHDKWVFTPLFR